MLFCIALEGVFGHFQAVQPYMRKFFGFCGDDFCGVRAAVIGKQFPNQPLRLRILDAEVPHRICFLVGKRNLLPYDGFQRCVQKASIRPQSHLFCKVDVIVDDCVIGQTVHISDAVNALLQNDFDRAFRRFLADFCNYVFKFGVLIQNAQNDPRNQSGLVGRFQLLMQFDVAVSAVLIDLG